MNIKKLILVCIILGLLVSCDDIFKKTIKVQFDQTTFMEQREQWQTTDIKNYTYRLLAYGYMGYDGIITVEDGVYKESAPATNDYEIHHFLDYSTMDEIYNTIEDAYKSNNNTENSPFEVYLEEIDVEYDKINHIPIKIHYKYYVPSTIAVDGTFYYEIKSFEKKQ